MIKKSVWTAKEYVDVLEPLQVPIVSEVILGNNERRHKRSLPQFIIHQILELEEKHGFSSRASPK